MTRETGNLGARVVGLLQAAHARLQPNFEDEYVTALKALLAGSTDAVTLLCWLLCPSRRPSSS